MKFTSRIAIRHLRSRHSFGFISFSTILSIVGLAIGVSSLIIISSISTGFFNIVNYKLSGIDGHMRIHSYISDRMTIDQIAEYDEQIWNISNAIVATSPYIKKNAIIRKGGKTEGIILYGIPDDALNSIFQLHRFSKDSSTFLSDNSIIIGGKLANLINVGVGDNMIMMNVEKMEKDKILYAKNIRVSQIFQTDFPEYDRLLAFMPYHSVSKFFSMDQAATGLLVNIDAPEDTERIKDIIGQQIDLYPNVITTWKERHTNLLKWLTLYDLPIKLIMLFIAVVGIFNIAASLWMIVIEKTKEFGILMSMGMGINKIQVIILKEGAYIGAVGAICGAIMSFIMLHLQNTFHMIRLPQDIYFMDYLPVEPRLIYFIFYPVSAFIITLIFSFYPARRASKISPVEALRYE